MALAGMTLKTPKILLLNFEKAFVESHDPSKAIYLCHEIFTRNEGK